MNSIYWQSIQRLNELSQFILNSWASWQENWQQSTLWVGSTEESPIANITIQETANKLVIKAHILDIDIKDLNIEVTEETLLIGGKWPERAGVEGYFHPGKFQSLIPFFSPVHPKTALAEFKDNILIIRILKQQIIIEPRIRVDLRNSDVMFPKVRDIERKEEAINSNIFHFKKVI